MKIKVLLLFLLEREGAAAWFLRMGKRKKKIVRIREGIQ